MDHSVPAPGQWPIDPQEDAPMDENAIWVDGCFDFSHHGHAGAMLQARQLGKSLWVGIHSDEDILKNKGPTVMNLYERCTAVDACRWSTVPVPHAPYVTQISWIDHYGCKYVVHGDDITSDSGGEDCYRFVKQAGRFKIVKRTPGISTTDIVGRMLLCTKSHFIKNLEDVLDGKEGSGTLDDKRETGKAMRQRIKEYASDESGHEPKVEVWSTKSGKTNKMVAGKAPQPGQHVVYVDGGFDLFTPGHIEFLRQVVETEEKAARSNGWFSEEESQKRMSASGKDYSPVYVVAGVHDDEEVNKWKGVNYPIMNIFERGMCVLQCKYISAMIFGAAFVPDSTFLHSLPYKMTAVYHGPTVSAPHIEDPYADAKRLGLYREVTDHKYSHINATEIVGRILKSRDMYEERQRVKGVKGIGEEAVRRREEMERAQAEKGKMAEEAARQ